MHSANAPVVEIGMVIGAWVVLFVLNHWLFASFEVTGYISWIFLPAAVRMLSVMQFGWRGVVGLLIGALLTNGPIIESQPGTAVVLSALSALGPVMAIWLSTRLLGIASSSIRELDALQIYVFAAMGAVCNVLPHTLFFGLIGPQKGWEETMGPMLIGDMTGTTIVLLLVALLRRRWGQRPFSRSEQDGTLS